MNQFIPSLIHEIYAFEKRVGKKPAQIILVSDDISDAFFKEIYEMTMKTDGLDFKSPGKFMDIPIYHKNIWTYGGQCRWLLVGE